VHAIDHLSISIPEGKITGLVGPNGSGKTTLINILSGFFPSSSGSVSIDGVEFKNIKPWDNPIYGITRTFQQVRLFEQMSVMDNLLVVLTERAPFTALFEKHKEFHINRAKDILELLELSEKKDSQVANLSYGQRKLLEIGRAMAMDAKIILFDEPFAGLFPEIVKRVEAIILKLKSEGRTIVLVEHNMNIIRSLSDHVIVMDAGKLLAEGNPTETLDKREVIEAYLGE
jgi:branched-chain amino acid transport system ATP-binding protein